jgi:hypothetical protein
MEDNASSTKQCIYCGEEILSVAVKCKHCRSNLSNDVGGDPPTPMSTKSNAGTIGGLIGASSSLYYWFLSNAYISNAIDISPFESYLNQAPNPEVALKALLISVSVTTLGAAFVFWWGFKLLFTNSSQK